MGDINGDGFADTCYMSFGSIDCITPQHEPLARLSGTINSFGVRSRFEYQPLLSGLYTSDTSTSRNELREVKQDRLVISAIRSDNGIGGDNAIRYRYQGFNAHEDNGLVVAFCKPPRTVRF